MTIRLEQIDDIASVFDQRVWPFESERAGEIDAHWQGLLAHKPRLFDGQVLLVDRFEIVPRNGRRVLETRHFATRYRAFLAWRDFGFPDMSVRNCFAAAALRCADGAFVLGEMAPHTANGGMIYFPAGTPDMGDVKGGAVDLAGSVLRELEEETGIGAEDVECAPGWTVVFEGARVGCMKIVQSRLDAQTLVERASAYIKTDPEEELVRMHVVRTPDDLRPDAMPPFIVAYLTDLLTR